MRLQHNASSSNAQNIEQFANWILQVGDGDIGEPNEGEGLVDIPSEFLITDVDESNPIAAIVDATYPDLLQSLSSHEYFQERAILASTQEVVDEVNEYRISLIPGEVKENYSLDSISKNDIGPAINDALYTSNYLNNIKCSGLPNHVLKLKVGAPVMLMRNIDQLSDLCNGTRLIVTNLRTRIIEAVIISGSNIGEKVPIPTMLLTPSDSTLPFKLQRRQFPIIVCFAMTITKSQGQSLSNIGLFFRRPVLTHGQLYVALSRVTHKNDLLILGNNNVRL